MIFHTELKVDVNGNVEQEIEYMAEVSCFPDFQKLEDDEVRSRDVAEIDNVVVD